MNACRWTTLAVCVTFALALTACSSEQAAPADNLPVGQSDEDRMADKFMVSAAHPLAVEAGLAVLSEGGSAMDATIAVQMVLGFVE